MFWLTTHWLKHIMSFTAHSVGMVFTWLVESYHKSGQHKHQNMPGTSSKSTYELLCLSRSVICDTYQLLNLKEKSCICFATSMRKTKNKKKLRFHKESNFRPFKLSCFHFFFFNPYSESFQLSTKKKETVDK